MTDVCRVTQDQLKAPPQSLHGDDRCLSATADRTEACRCNKNGTAATDIRNPAEEARAAAIRAPARVKRAAGGADVLRALENRHRWLLFAQHCYTCSQNEDVCELGKLCTYGKKTLKHVAQCKQDDCLYPRCGLLKPLLQHSRKCQSSTCAICVPVWNYIQRDLQQQQQQQPLPAAAPAPPPPPQPQPQHHEPGGAPSEVAQTGHQQLVKQPISRGAPPPPQQSRDTPETAAQAPVSELPADLLNEAAACAVGTTVRDGAAAALGREVSGPADGAATGNTTTTTTTTREVPANELRLVPPLPLPGAGVSCASNGGETGGRLSYTGSPTPQSGNGADTAGGIPRHGHGNRNLPTAVPGAGATGNSWSGRPAAGETQLLVPEQQSRQGLRPQQPHLQHQVQQQPEAGTQPRIVPSMLPVYTTVGPQTVTLGPSTPQVVAAATASDTLPPYTLPPYNGAVAAPAGASPPPLLPRPKGIVITAAPPQPIPVISCAPIRPPPTSTAAGQTQLVHSYQATTCAGQLSYPHISNQLPQAPGHSAVPPTVTTPHWLSLPGLTAVSGPAPVAAGGASSGAGGGTAAGGPAAAALWHNPGALLSGPVALYGITPDASRPGGGVGALALPGAVHTAEQYGRTATYAFNGVNGSAGLPAATSVLSLSAAPFLLWQGGQTTTAAAMGAAAPPPPPGGPGLAGAAGAGQGGASAAHVAQQYGLGTAAGGRLNTGTPSFGVGAATPATALTGISGPSATANIPPHHLSPQPLLYGVSGTPGMPSGPPGPMAGPSASLHATSSEVTGAAAGNGATGLSAEVASGPAAWSYLIR